MSLSLDELDSHLFKCADIIRNTVDKTDYKGLQPHPTQSKRRSTGFGL